MRKALVIYNPTAGRFPVKPFLKAIETELVKADWKAEIVATQSGEHAVQLGQQAAAEKYEAAFAVGGDGTIEQVAGGLVGSETALGVLPAGTSNVWAQ
jgi:diacylglycerol kinase (ATP)